MPSSHGHRRHHHSHYMMSNVRWRSMPDVNPYIIWSKSLFMESTKADGTAATKQVSPFESFMYLFWLIGWQLASRSVVLNFILSYPNDAFNWWAVISKENVMSLRMYAYWQAQNPFWAITAESLRTSCVSSILSSTTFWWNHHNSAGIHIVFQCFSHK